MLEPFVREVAAHPEKFLAMKGISVLEDNIESYPNQHKFFPKGAYERFYSQIGWVKEDAARHHDALIATLAFRKRDGHRSPDIFDARHVVVTRNPSFPMLARRIALENGFINTTQVGPAIHSRQLATAVWLRTGMPGKGQIPRSYILAACRRVLTLRRNIVEKVNEFKATLSPEQAEQLEILMTSDRSTQVLMDKTLGVSNVIDSKSMPTLLDEMKKAQIAEYAAERDAEAAALATEANRRERALSEAAEMSSLRAQQAEKKAAEGVKRIRGIYEKVVERTNIKIIRQRRIFLVITTALLLISTTIASFTFDAGLILKIAAFVVVSIITILLHVISSLRDVFVDRWFVDRDHAILEQTSLEFGLGCEELVGFVVHLGHSFSLIPASEEDGKPPA